MTFLSSLKAILLKKVQSLQLTKTTALLKRNISVSLQATSPPRITASLTTLVLVVVAL